ncbi:ATP-binding protein [Methylomonas methanica]|uniref:AAA ATPase central domain protein n=1 Tax=Methylomonas methanica (strain DSM 25384 / MC09) TaxID=857087 RepID=F9ZW17_METMM|nr:ATP-binding protein [Methylomonas methanica]AEG00821.1 AAA ATPase central domain protein [Methylomonas methanica MC09]
MTHSMPPRVMIHAGQELAENLVLTALAMFADMHMPQTPELVQEMNATQHLQRILQQPDRSWLELVESLDHSLPRLAGNLGQVVRDFGLNAADFFVLSLCGVVESHHQACMLIGLLQQPQQLRPELHLISALCRTLFQEHYTAVDLYQHALLKNGFLQLEGDEPLPLRRLKMAPQLWQLLNGKLMQWQGCRPLALPKTVLLPPEILQSGQQLALLLAQKRIAAVVLRGEPQNCLLLANQLALSMALQAVVVDPSVYQDRQLGLLARYGRWLPILKPQLGPGERMALPEALSETPLVVVLGRDGSVETSGVTELLVSPLAHPQRQTLWQALLPNFDSAAIAETAQLSAPAIVAVAEQAQLRAIQNQETLQDKHLLQARFSQSADQLRLLAQPVERRVDADMLILPDALNQQLQHLTMRCRRRESMSEGLGPTFDTSENLGVRALFIGESGTGKTLAASYLASSLSAPLYRVDLAAVMNKYIGETEKNLSLMLDQAADHDVVLLLDEADALFGKRSDGGEVSERFANMLTNFLLTRIEQHPGIIILTSNSQARIDKAFMRRLDAVLEFPLPDVEQRRRLWLSHFGSRGPGDEFVQLLAQHCELPGGYIRNAVLNAAVVNEDKLGRAAILQALAWEYQKLGRQLPPQLDRFRRA